jgi:HI0933-like protein
MIACIVVSTEWFRSRGVALKTEADGRMFPTTDSSQTIIDCLAKAAHTSGVRYRSYNSPFTANRWSTNVVKLFCSVCVLVSSIRGMLTTCTALMYLIAV